MEVSCLGYTGNVRPRSPPDNGETWFQGFESLKRFNDTREEETRRIRGGVRISGKLIFLTTNLTNSTVRSPRGRILRPSMEACARPRHFKYLRMAHGLVFPLAELPWTWFDLAFFRVARAACPILFDSLVDTPDARYHPFIVHRTIILVRSSPSNLSALGIDWLIARRANELHQR